MRLSKLKFSSNVIEKCLELEQSQRIIELILKGESCQEDKTLIRLLGPAGDCLSRLKVIVEHLANDQFGNYVL